MRSSPFVLVGKHKNGNACGAHPVPVQCLDYSVASVHSLRVRSKSCLYCWVLMAGDYCWVLMVGPQLSVPAPSAGFIDQGCFL